MVLISIIVPIYNVEYEYLKKCIKSILKQTLKDIEIILINDGSTNGCEKICNEYAKKDSRIKVIHKKNQGVSVARNIGIEKSTGNLIMFVDADDWLENDACENFKKAMDKDTDIVLSAAFLESGNKQEEIKLKFSKDQIFINKDKEFLQNKIFIESGYCGGSPWAKCYKKEFLLSNKLNFIKGLTWGEDGLFNFEAYHFSKKIKYINCKTYHYRVNPNSVTGGKFNNKIPKDYLNLMNEWQNLLKKYNVPDKFKNSFNCFCIRYISYILKRYIGNKQNKKNNYELTKELKYYCNHQINKVAIKNVKLNPLTLKRKLIVVLLRLKQFYLLVLMSKIDILKK